MTSYISKPRMGPPLGNKNGTANGKTRICKESLVCSLAKVEWNGSRGDPGETLDRINDKLVYLALNAEPESDDFKWALEMIHNRVDGKPATALDLGGDSELPIAAIVIRGVTPEISPDLSNDGSERISH
jgi:hypothetical protein